MVGSVLTSGLKFNFTQDKVRGRHASQSELYILKNYPHSKTHRGINSPLKKTLLPLKNKQMHCFFLVTSPTPPPPRYPKSWWVPIILTFFIFKHFVCRIFFFFCGLKFQILVFFLCRNCNLSLPLLKKVTPLFQQPLSKNWDPVRPPFLKIL